MAWRWVSPHPMSVVRMKGRMDRGPRAGGGQQCQPNRPQLPAGAHRYTGQIAEPITCSCGDRLQGEREVVEVDQLSTRRPSSGGRSRCRESQGAFRRGGCKRMSGLCRAT